MQDTQPDAEFIPLLLWGSQATPQAIADSVYGTEYNKGMGLTKSAHLVAGWEHNFDYPIRRSLKPITNTSGMFRRNGSFLLLLSQWRYRIWSFMG